MKKKRKKYDLVTTGIETRTQLVNRTTAIARNLGERFASLHFINKEIKEFLLEKKESNTADRQECLTKPSRSLLKDQFVRSS